MSKPSEGSQRECTCDDVTKGATPIGALHRRDLLKTAGVAALTAAAMAGGARPTLAGDESQEAPRGPGGSGPGGVKADNFDQADPGYGKVFGSDAEGKPAASGKLLEVHHAADQQLQAYDGFFQENQDRHLKEVAELVAFPTLAMVPEHAEDLRRAAEYLKKKLTTIGMKKATVHPADGFPLVTAEWRGAEGQPTVLFYGHYDIQPVVKERWNTDPYKAEIKDGRMYGRGATDDKGPIIMLLSAVEAMMKLDGKLPVNVMFLLDGAEEFGSQTMQAWLEANASWVKGADYGYNVDAMMFSDDRGLMWKGLRGGGEVQVTLTSAKSDLHSGIYGGAVPSAAISAARVISSMWNDDGTVAVKGFYDDLVPPTPEERHQIAEAIAGLDEEAAKKQLGIAEFIGEKDYSVVERTWVRGSLDVTGVKSGYTEGAASVIPSTAWFRVQSRTGPGQDPAKVNQQIMDHIRARVPWGVKVEMTSAAAGSAPSFKESDIGFAVGKTVLTEFFGKPPRVLWIGGGVPALSYVPDAGGPNLVSFGFQRSDEGFHADNEFMRISSFQSGQRAYARLLHALVGQPSR